jgi:hypothetical protein
VVPITSSPLKSQDKPPIKEQQIGNSSILSSPTEQTPKSRSPAFAKPKPETVEEKPAPSLIAKMPVPVSKPQEPGM